MSLGLDVSTPHSGALRLGLMASVLVLQASVILFLLHRFKASHSTQEKLYQELFGLTRKIEGLSSGRRALIAYHLDMLLERLVKQLPSRISAEAGDVIFRTESSMLKTLADLEPNLPQLPGMKDRVESLVSSMERLESTVVSVTGEAVRQAIFDTKRSILEADSHEDRS